jgi:extracellular factor (EF) 3-hydroxypalmitic acid methyl ester biosynthesis protein
MTDLSQEFVSFVGEDGVEVRGSLVRVAPQAVAFEVFQPTITVRLSQVLSPVKIHIGQELVYDGRAVIVSVVTTDKGSICEAQLSDAWIDVGPMDVNKVAAGLRQSLSSFFVNWQQQYRVDDRFKLVIADMENFFDHLRLWLGQVELRIRRQPADVQARLEKEFWKELGADITHGIRVMFDRFEEVARQIAPADVPAHRAFARRLIHPLLLASPFVHRTYTKPLGYAGDYEMVNMMVRDAVQGPNLFSKAINIYALDLPPILAHRNRLDILRRRLSEEAVRRSQTGRQLEVLNVGCGPAQEIVRFLNLDAVSDRVAFTLIDFNEQTIKDTQRELEQIKARQRRKTTLEFTRQSVQQILKQSVRKVTSAPARTYDFIYCAGLFDYLPDSVCLGLMNYFYELLKPGGVVLSTNVDDHPSRLEMEFFLEWHLIYRDHDRMWRLRPESAAREDCRLYCDDTGVNLFLEAEKPARV